MGQLIDILAIGLTDDSGDPLSGGLVYFYKKGTTQLQTVYRNNALTLPHPNPATLDAAGRLIAYTDESLRVPAFNSSSELIRTYELLRHHRGLLESADLTQFCVKRRAIDSSLAGNGLTQDLGGALAVNPGTGLSVVDDKLDISPNWSEILFRTGATHGSTGTKIRRFGTVALQYGDDLEVTQSSENGDSVEVQNDGVYCVSYLDYPGGVSKYIGISINASSLTTNIESITATERIALTTGNTGDARTVCAYRFLSAGDVIRAHTDGSPTATTYAKLHIVRVRLGYQS